MTRFGRRRIWVVVALVAAAVIATAVWGGARRTGEAAATATARRGEFIVDIATTGQVEAVRSRNVSRKRIGRSWNASQVVQLAPEGSVVKEGDFLVQLDMAETTTQLEEAKNALLNARAELARQTAESDSRLAELESAVLTQQYSHEQAKLRTEAMKFEAEVRRREQELELRKSELSLQEARDRLAAQHVIARAEHEKSEFSVRQAQLQVGQAEEALAAMTITAPEAGLVVYKTYRQGKVKVGDQVWPGMDLIELPDLAQMQVRTRVNEVDVRQVAVDQEVIIRVDALDGQEIPGKVSRIATLARTEGEAKVKVFDVDVLVTGSAEELRPGMTAQCRIIVSRLADVVSVPLEAVFEREGQSVVFVVPGNGKPVPVTVGARSDDFVEIVTGLTGGEAVALSDPEKPAPAAPREEAKP
jgi:HlyD family secretion protein